MTDALFVVFDLDGTLCNIDHRLHLIQGEGKKRWEDFNAQCVHDTVIEPVRELFWAIKAGGYIPIILTGRSEAYRPETDAWLRLHAIDSANLLMRPLNDYRSDYIVKLELIQQRVSLHEIVFAVEDRDRVVQAWRDAGVTCLQPCKGSY